MEHPREKLPRRWFSRPVTARPTDQEAEVRATLYAPPTERERTVQPVGADRRMRPAA
jgi:hypothetical protein